MQNETRQCQNCKNDFTIESEDFSFYDKIKVPSPTFCPECRLMRRMAWRGERFLYKRICPFTGKSVITCFSEESGVPVVDRDYWWSDDFNPLDYARDYDFSKSFFEQWQELLKTVPSIPLFNAKSQNSPYTNYAGELKDVYMSFGMWNCQNVMYCSKVVDSKDSLDLYWSTKCEFCYDLVNCQGCYGSRYLVDSANITTSAFLLDCRGCTDCFMSANLRNKQYVFRGIQLSREEYQNKIKEINFGSQEEVSKFKEEFNVLCQNSIHKYSHKVNSYDSEGDYLTNTNNCKKCFDLVDVEDCSYCVSGGAGMKDTYDVYGAGAKAEQMYEVLDSGDNASKLLFTLSCWGGYEVYYSSFCHNSSNLFGCIGVHKKEYCILNKQYGKEEYLEMVEKIKKHMTEMPYVDSRGVVYSFGEFFPGELSPFDYNKTIGQEYLPLLSEEETQDKGFIWGEPYKSSNKPTILYSDIPDDINNTSEEILKEAFECADSEEWYSTKVFNIVPNELSFYKRMNVPIPRKSPNARHYDRLKKRNPIKLWHRQCMCDKKHNHHEGQCDVEFETSYAPDRPEIVYCEKCYQQEVY